MDLKLNLLTLIRKYPDHTMCIQFPFLPSCSHIVSKAPDEIAALLAKPVEAVEAMQSSKDAW